MQKKREVFHPARVAGFLFGLISAAGFIAIGIDMHRDARFPGEYQSRSTISYPGP